MSDRQDNATVNVGTGDQEFTVGTSDNTLLTKQNEVKVKTLERCFIERIDWELSNIFDTVENRIQRANLTTTDFNIAKKIELAIRSKIASSGRDATSLT